MEHEKLAQILDDLSNYVGRQSTVGMQGIAVGGPDGGRATGIKGTVIASGNDSGGTYIGAQGIAIAGGGGDLLQELREAAEMARRGSPPASMIKSLLARVGSSLGAAGVGAGAKALVDEALALLK